MRRIGRDVPLPNEMQGRWTDLDEPSSELIVSNGEIICFGQPVEYDYKLIDEVAGAVIVSLKIDNEADEDSFQRANITELVITPEGNFHAYNVRFQSQFVRSGA